MCRLVHSSDEPAYDSYPLRTSWVKLRKKKCRICDMYAATVACVDDYLAPENPCLFCDQCFNLFHVDDNGNNVYDAFKVFPYWHHQN